MEDRARPQDGSRDFDFLLGRWRVQNRRLVHRLKHSSDWEEFEATVTARGVLGGLGNVDEFETDHWGPRFLGMSLRLYNPGTRLWSIYWADNRSGALLPPVIGSFSDGVGVFEGPDECAGQPVISRFTWSEITGTSARWEQAFSPDARGSWETNWIMRFSRLPTA
jgi:hypothetical protein